MIKFCYPNLKGFLAIALLLFLSFHANAVAPKWSTGYPKAINGATSIDFTINVDQNSTIYYVVYNVLPSNPTPASIKEDARAAAGGSISKNGVATIKSLTETKVSITGLKDGKTYYSYIIVENTNAELQGAADLKSFTQVLPVRHSSNSYRSSFTPAGGIVGYLAYFPEEYYKNPSANYPVMIFLHGSGEKTYMTDNISLLDRIKVNGPPKLIEQGKEFPFIVISPQCPFADWDDVGGSAKPGDFVNEIVEMVKSSYRVDINRMYLTGLSMGGGGTFSYVQNYPGKMAAAIPIAGWGDPNKGCAMTDLGIWAFQGQYDGSEGIVNIVNSINACKTSTQEKAKVTIYAGGGHDAWTATYDNTGSGIAPDNIYDWLLRHSRNSVVNQNPIVDAGADISGTLPLTSIRLAGTAKDNDGTISSYTWTQISGTTLPITGLTSATATVSSLLSGSFTFRLTVKDNAGGTSFDDVVVTINPALVINKLPVANAGADKTVTLPMSSVSIAGSGTDVDGSIVSYVWSQVSGPSSTISGANSPTVSLTSLNPGTYTLRLTVTDNLGGSASDEEILIVKPGLVSSPPPPSSLLIGNLMLCDADKSAELIPFTNGSTLDLNAYPTVKYYTILVKNTTSDIGSIVFTLDGNMYRTENKAPFSLTGNCYPGYNCYGAYWRPSVGIHTIIATAYSGAGGTGTKGTSISTTFTVVSTTQLAVRSNTGNLLLSELVLADADRNADISPLVNGSTLNLSSLGVRNYTVLAKTETNDIGSVVFTLDGNLFRIEDHAPFSLTGNCYGGYKCYGAYWQPSVGSHTVTATAYSLAGGMGTKGTSLSAQFNVVSSSSRISEEEISTEIQVSPNPFVNNLKVSFATPLNLASTISIIDAQGSTIYQSFTTGETNGTELDLSAQNLKAGLYVLQVVSENGEKRSAKVVKQ